MEYVVMFAHIRTHTHTHTQATYVVANSIGLQLYSRYDFYNTIFKIRITYM
jgi:hypothetical protein